MQERKGTRRTAGMRWWQCLSRTTAILLLVTIASAALLYACSSNTELPHGSPEVPEASKTVALNGAYRWVGDTQTTAPAFDFTLPDTRAVSVSPLFAHYYSSHGGASSLGNPVTVAFLISQGWIQFFHSSALLLLAAQSRHVDDIEADDDPLDELIDTGVRDSSTGIICLPLLQALLTVGSQVAVGGDGSLLTYVDLRKATNPDLMVTAPVADPTATPSSSESQGVFIKGGTRAGKDVGHMIPQPLWSYIHRSDVSPDGWETDFGAPLTEALAFTINNNGGTHQMLVQVFWRDGLVLDQDTGDASGQFQIERLNTGVAYLRTIGTPPVAISEQQIAWAQGDTTLLDAPGTGQAVAHVGQHFPLTLLRDTAWNKGTLWYHAQWDTPKRTGSGWVPATAITFTSPGSVPGWASFDVLSPDLAAYLASIGGNVNAVVYDVTRQRYYTYHANAQFIMGSSMKVPIMLTFLDITERQGREPDDSEMNLLTTMIENSNNDSASALYYGEIGGAAGVAGYLQRIGIRGLDPDPDAWGYSLVSPLTMVNILTLLYEGKILTAQDRHLAFYLMEHIEPDQQVGVGDTAPGGATVAMKDGWLPGPDDLWAMNSSGIVMLSGETYIIAVYTHEQGSLDDGQAIARHVCGAVAELLS